MNVIFDFINQSSVATSHRLRLSVVMCLFTKYKLSASETVRLLSGYILPRNALNFTHCHQDFKNFPGEKPQVPCLQGQRRGGDGKGLKGSHLYRKGREVKDRGGVRDQRDGRGKEGRGGPATGGGGLAPRS